MKKFLGMFVVGIFLTTGSASAQMDMMGSAGQNMKGFTVSDQHPGIAPALQDIYKSQNITDREHVDCSKVTDLELIKLGDGVMGYGVTEEDHEAMENMMGGEEAPMSKQAHINMGRAYLGCWSNYKSGPINMPMMGGYMANPTATVNTAADNRVVVRPGMMQGLYMGGGVMGGHYGFGGVMIFFVWILLILSILALVKWLMKN